MPKTKQKLRLPKHIKRQLVLPVTIAALSVAVLVIASVQAFSSDRACVSAPISPYPSMQLILQKGDKRTDKTVTNRHIIGCISDDLRHLPQMPGGDAVVHCPLDDGSTFILSFDGGRIVTGSLTGCQAVKIQGDNKVYWLTPSTSYTRDFRSKLQKLTQ